MQIIKRGTVDKYAFDWRDKVALEVFPGETFQVETNDALSGLVADDSDEPIVNEMDSPHVERLQTQWPPLYNPVVGPIYVQGCENGDVLAIDIDWGVHTVAV